MLACRFRYEGGPFPLIGSIRAQKGEEVPTEAVVWTQDARDEGLRIKILLR